MSVRPSSTPTLTGTRRGGGTGETPSQSLRQSWQIAPARERRSRCPLQPVLAAALSGNQISPPISSAPQASVAAKDLQAFQL